jgi:hypothetical protein
MKVYIINTTSIDLFSKDKRVDFQSVTDEEFKEYSDKYGTSYSLRGFENAINQDDFDHVNTYIRFIE